MKAVAVVLLGAILCAPGEGGAAAPEPGSTPLTVVTRVYDRKQLLAAPELSTDARKGRALWLQRCAYCHDGVGQPTYRTMGSWLGAETVELLGPEALRAIIGAGTERMPGFRYTPAAATGDSADRIPEDGDGRIRSRRLGNWPGSPAALPPS